MSQLDDAPSTQQTQPRAHRQRRPTSRYTPGTDALGKGKTKSSKQCGTIWVVHINFVNCLDVLFFMFEHYGLFGLFGFQLFVMVVLYLSFVSMDIINANLLCLWVP